MPENHIKILTANEDRAARIVQAAIEQASGEMELLAQRYLAQGRREDVRRVLEQMTLALDDLAREYSLRVVQGPWGRLLVNAATLGAESVRGAAFTLSKPQVDVALYNAGWKIKGVLDQGVAAVQDIVAGGMIRGDSLREMSKAIEARVQVEGGLIDRARADMIARSEVFGVYRQTSFAAANAEEIDLFQMTGPMDSRTTAICAAHVGQVKTEKQWNAIRKDALIWGLHYQCRHSFDPVRNADSPATKRMEAWGEKQRAALKEAA